MIIVISVEKHAIYGIALHQVSVVTANDNEPHKYKSVRLLRNTWMTCRKSYAVMLLANISEVFPTNDNELWSSSWYSVGNLQRLAKDAELGD